MSTDPSATSPRRARRLTGRLGGLAALALLLTGCRGSWRFENNPGATTQGQKISHMFVGFDITALAVGAIVWGLIFFCVLFFRRRSRDHWPKQTRYNIPWEIAYTIAPIFVVVGLFAVTVVGENAVDKVVPNPKQQLTVTGFQWGWRFDYSLGNGQHAVFTSDPTNFQTVELPLGQTTRVNLLSADVVHNFLISAFNFQRYAQPGVTNVFDFTPTKTGTFIGRCDFFCGLHHDLMIFYVKVVPPAQFQTWVHQNAKAAA